MKLIVICRSNKYHYAAEEWVKKVTSESFTLYNPPSVTVKEEWDQLSNNEKRLSILKLANDHFRKIDEADMVFLFNKDGYIGPSVTMELGYSIAKNKPIIALELDQELARDVFIQAYTPDIESLKKFMKNR